LNAAYVVVGYVLFYLFLAFALRNLKPNNPARVKSFISLAIFAIAALALNFVWTLLQIRWLK